MSKPVRIQNKQAAEHVFELEHSAELLNELVYSVLQVPASRGCFLSLSQPQNSDT